MISRRTKQFRRLLASLSKEVRRQAEHSFRLWQANPTHPSLHFKKIHTQEETWSVRVTDDYRVVGVRREKTMVWFWIGRHAEYEDLIKKLQE